MNRRTFLVRAGSTLIAAPFALELVSCGSSSNPTNPPPATDRFSGTGTGSGHTHSLTMLCTQLQAGMALSITSGVGGSPPHTHDVPFSTADLATLSSGTQDVIQTTSPHPHTWTIQKPAGVC